MHWRPAPVSRCEGRGPQEGGEGFMGFNIALAPGGTLSSLQRPTLSSSLSCVLPSVARLHLRHLSDGLEGRGGPGPEAAGHPGTQCGRGGRAGSTRSRCRTSGKRRGRARRRRRPEAAAHPERGIGAMTQTPAASLAICLPPGNPTPAMFFCPAGQGAPYDSVALSPSFLLTFKPHRILLHVHTRHKLSHWDSFQGIFHSLFCSCSSCSSSSILLLPFCSVPRLVEPVELV